MRSGCFSWSKHPTILFRPLAQELCFGVQFWLLRKFDAPRVQLAPTRRASRRSRFRSPIHLPLHEFELCDLSLGLSVGPGDMIAARTAVLSFMTPFAKDATRLAFARSIQASSSASFFLRIMAWKAAMTLRASTSCGAPLSIAVIVTAFGQRSIGRRAREDTAPANFRALGICPNAGRAESCV